MRVLITNDDGIEARGLAILASALMARGHTVWSIAPRHNWSGGSHSVTVTGAIEVNRSSKGPGHLAWMVDGSPADTVRVASAILPAEPHLVVSGVNDGPNLASDIYCSGTVGAAREAALHGFPALALSAMSLAAAPILLARHLAALSELAVEHRGAVVNVNLPRSAQAETELVAVAEAAFLDEARIQRGGREGQYWVSLSRRLNDGPGLTTTDVGVVLAGKVAVSLLTLKQAQGPVFNAEQAAG